MSRHRAYHRPIAVVALVAAAAATALTPGVLDARTYKAVRVEGAEFIPAEDIKVACEIAPGVDYSGQDLANIEDCLMNSGEFSSVSVVPEGDALVVKVSEANNRPGRVDLSLAYDSRDGVIGSVYFERYNLFPKTFGSIDLTLSAEARQLSTSLYRAGIGGGLDFGFDTSIRETSYDDQGFDTQRVTVEPYLAYPLADRGRVEVGLGYRADEMSNVVPGASSLFVSEAGRINAPYLRFGLSYEPQTDEQDRRGVTGLSFSLNQFFWGLGTDDSLSETRIDGRSRFAIGERVDLIIGFQGGIVTSTGDSPTRTTDRFVPGGADFRGFATRGLGPKDGDYFVGGNQYFVSTLEVQTSLDRVLGGQARLGAFVDIGSAWGLDVAPGGVDDSRKIRSSAGLSLTFDVGNVPVSVYVAKPLSMETGDKEQNFGISLSSTF